MHSNILIILLLLSASVGAVGLARRFRGRHRWPVWRWASSSDPRPEIAVVEPGSGSLAELGVAFLMSSIGLEFSLQRLKSMRHLVFGFGGAQVAITATATAMGTWFGYGQRWEAGLAVGHGGGHVLHRHRGPDAVRAL